MSEWKGKVSKTSEREWGKDTLYSWQFEGANLWFRSDFDPKLVEGDFYTAEGESPNKNTNVSPTTSGEVREASKEETKTIMEAPPTNSPDYWRWKQLHDLEKESAWAWKDARADATRIVCAALDNDVLALGSAKGKKLDIVMGMVNQITQQLVDEMGDK